MKQVSWTEYLSIVAALLAVYYFIVILLFYRDEVRQVLAGKRKLFARGEADVPDGNK